VSVYSTPQWPETPPEPPHWGITLIDLEIAGRTLDRTIRILGSSAERFPSVARLIGDLGIARQSADEAMAALRQGGGR
jgi:hypothetical protein